MCRKIGKIGLMGLGLLLFLLTGRPTMADDWPQWRGLERNGLSKEANWLNGWPAGQAPRVAWRAQVGRGHSAVSVSNGRAYTLGWDGQRETVFCFEAATGKMLWKQSYSSGDIVQWPGPRATPTVHKGTLYTLGQHGQLRAFDALTGKVRWSRQLPASYQPDPDYGFAWSPLVMEDLLLFSAGRKGLALYAADGRFAWGHDGQHGTCVSAVPFVHEGKHGVALLTNPDRESVWLVGVEPRTGTELWRHGPWREKWGAACVDLIISGGKVFLTTAEQYPRCARFSILGRELKEDWTHNKLAVYTGGCVLVGEHLYAVTRAGLLKCLDWNTGAEKWSQRGFGGHGTLIAADNLLIVQASESGELRIVEATPAGYRERRRAVVFTGKPDTFTAPALAEGRLYCRSYEGEVVCLDLRARP